MTRRLVGKVALVTGAASGIGRSAAIRFAQEGAAVALADIDGEGVTETLREVDAVGGVGVFFPADVSKAGDVERMVAATVYQFGRLDIALNNAGIPGTTDALTGDYDEAEWLRVIAVNLKGVFLSMQSELRYMLAKKQGVIVNTASVAGIGAFRGCAAYVASKHAIIGLTRAAALEYASSGIRINAVCPGFVDTPLLGLRGEASEAGLKGRVPLGRIADPVEVAEAAVWLCTDAASYVVGHAMVIDGGVSVRL